MEKIDFVNNDMPALNARTLNKLQDNIEDAIEEQAFDDVTVEHIDVEDLEANTITSKRGNLVVDSIRSKNILGTNSYKSFTFNTNGNATYSFSDDTTIIINAAAQNYSGIFGNILLYANIDTTKQYTISFDAVANTDKNMRYGISPNQTDVTLTTTVQRLSFTMNGSDLINKNTVFYGMGSNSATITISKFQIEEGDTTTSFSFFQNLDAGPVLVWQNSNTSADFNAQDVNISNLSEFAYYEIIYKQRATSQNYMQSSGKIPIGQNCCLGGGVLRTSAAPRFWARFVTYGTNKLTFSAGYYEGTSDNSASTANDIIIPYQILLYK